MKAALIGDIHANLPALEAVTAHARQHGAEQFWNIGDFVGYNAFPEEVVRALMRPDVISIAGNYDRKVLKAEQKAEKWRKSDKDPDKIFSFVWSYRQLSAQSREFLSTLPDQHRLEVEGWRVLLVHGSPYSINEHLLPDTPQERLEELARAAQADIVICGHSHRAFVRRALETWFINTGSVGRPDDGDPRACYALLTLRPDDLAVVHYRVAYNVERAVQAIQMRGLPEDFARMIHEGKNLDAVKYEEEEDEA